MNYLPTVSGLSQRAVSPAITYLNICTNYVDIYIEYTHIYKTVCIAKSIIKYI